MAKKTHVSIIKKGAKTWNEWRFAGKRNRRPDLSGATLSFVDLRAANLSFANLSSAKLALSTLDRTDLRGANLAGALIDGALIRSSDLFGTNFAGADIAASVFADVDLSACTGLDSLNHFGPSTLGVDSIVRSKGRIPEVFLRGVGLPDEWIDYIPSLTSEFEFFSTFISHSSLDRPFAVRLYDALQFRGIRRWLDEKQLLPGDDISRQLERGIHLWDKFLLCASRNSLTSWWVEDEIKTTLEKERALRKERSTPVWKLIPLNLDGYMFTKE